VGPMEQLEPGHIGFRFLTTAEFQGEQLDANLLHDPRQPLLIPYNNADRRHQPQLLDDSLESMTFEHVVQFVAQHSCDLLGVLGLLQKRREHDDISAGQCERVDDLAFHHGNLEGVGIAGNVSN
jgi:hypothetical protein